MGIVVCILPKHQFGILFTYFPQVCGKIKTPQTHTARTSSKSYRIPSTSCSRHIPRSILHALRKAGINETPNLNSPYAPAACTGSTDHIVNKSADRDSTYRAFLSPKLTQQRKSHLKICTNTLATRIDFGDGTPNRGLRATGVFFEANHPRQAIHRYFARARREIILCAGAFASPQILMLRYSLFLRHAGVYSNRTSAV